MRYISKKETKDKLLAILGLFVFFVLFNYSYITFLSRIYHYEGYLYSFNLHKILVGIALFIIYLYLFYKLIMNDFMFLINIVFYLFMVIPPITFYMFHPQYPVSLLIANLLFVLLLLAVSHIKIKMKKVTYEIKPSFILIMIIVLFIPIFVEYKFNFISTSLIHYNFLKRQENLADLTKIWRYIIPWIYHVILPFYIAVFLYKRKYVFAIVLFILLIYLYLIFSIRKIYFTAVLTFLFGFSRNFKKNALYLLLMVIGGYIFAIAVRIFTGYIGFESIYRRIFAVYQLINIFYFDFFKHNHLYLSYSILSPFFSYPYALEPRYLIGELYLHKSYLISANTGFIAQGMADFGYYGIVLYSLIVIAIFVFLNSLDLHPVFTGLIISFIFTVVDTYITTVLMTHGALVLFILLYFFAYKKET